MAITPNYSWPLPDDTSLVKDGAEAIRDLGNAIDTTVDGLGSGGLVHIETATGSAVASLSINDIFSATYSNYVMFLSFIPSTGLKLRARLRVGGSDNTESNYSGYHNIFTSALSNVANYGPLTIWDFNTSGGNRHYQINLANPFATKETIGTMIGAAARTNELGSFRHDATTSFTGITFITSTGTFTEIQVQVFGVKQ